MIEKTNAKPLKMRDRGMAAIFAGMAALYDPEFEPDLNAVIQFNLEKKNYFLVFNENECKAYGGSHPEPTTTIITTADNWMKISMGEIDGARGFTEGLFKVEGDVNLLLKMDQMFKRDALDDSSRTVQNFDKIPDHRGPLKIPGMLWMNIAFIPWIILWIWGSFSPGLLVQIVVAGVALIITLYHVITNRPTLFELGTCIYFIFAAILYAINWNFFLAYSRVINYIFIGGLWLGSLFKQHSLTAEYVRYAFPKQIWGMRAFLKTNDILTGIWGIFFLFMAYLNFIIITNSELTIILTIISYLLLIPMFMFTSWFQKWYPPRLIGK